MTFQKVYVDWEKVRPVLKACNRQLQQKIEEVAERYRGTIGMNVISRYGFGWSVIDVWIPHTDKRRKMEIEPDRYVRLNQEELQRISGMLGEIIKPFPKLEIVLTSNISGVRSYSIRVKNAPHIRKPPTAAQAKRFSQEADFNRIGQFLSRHRGMSPSWDDDVPVIAEKTGVTEEVVRKYARTHAHA